MRIRVEFEGGGATEMYMRPASFTEDDKSGAATMTLQREHFPYDLSAINEVDGVTVWDLSRPAFPKKWVADEIRVEGEEAVFYLRMVA